MKHSTRCFHSTRASSKCSSIIRQDFYSNVQGKPAKSSIELVNFEYCFMGSVRLDVSTIGWSYVWTVDGTFIVYARKKTKHRNTCASRGLNSQVTSFGFIKTRCKASMPGNVLKPILVPILTNWPCCRRHVKQHHLHPSITIITPKSSSKFNSFFAPPSHHHHLITISSPHHPQHHHPKVHLASVVKCDCFVVRVPCVWLRGLLGTPRSGEESPPEPGATSPWVATLQ